MPLAKRGPAEWPALLSLPKIETLIALDAGRPAGYLMVSAAVNKPGLIEAGGDPAAVETLLHTALGRLAEDAEITAWANRTPTVLGDLLHQRMPDRRQPAAMHAMIRINDVPAFLRSISPWLVSRNAGQQRAFSIGITDTEQTVSFEFSQDGLQLGSRGLPAHVDLSLRELTGIIFGPHPARPVDAPPCLADLFPFYFPIWILDHS